VRTREQREVIVRSLGLLVLRIATGGLLIAHGYPKLFGGENKKPPVPMRKIYGKNFEAAVERGGPDAFAQALEQMKVPAPKASAYLSGVAEFGGGLALLLGFQTRAAAPAVMFNMGTAIRKVHWDNGFYGEGGYEFPLLIGASALTLFLAGPGAISIDAVTGALKAAGSHDEDEA